jgi:hypothetical protein
MDRSLTATVATALLLAVTTAPTPAHATNAITSFVGGTVYTGFSFDETVGWAFSSDADIMVTNLGWGTGDDFATVSPHEVGIWTDAGTLMGSATVTAGPANDGVWRFVATAPIALFAGQTYVIGGRDSVDGDTYVGNIGSASFAAGIGFLGSAVSDPSSGFAFPGDIDPDAIGRFGPNFRFEPAQAVIPEPVSWAMLIAGFGLVGLAARRRRTAANGVSHG